MFPKKIFPKGIGIKSIIFAQIASHFSDLSLKDYYAYRLFKIILFKRKQ